MVARSGNPKTENNLLVFSFTMRFHSAYVFLVKFVHSSQYNGKLFASVSFSVRGLELLERLQIFSNFSLT